MLFTGKRTVLNHKYLMVEYAQFTSQVKHIQAVEPIPVGAIFWKVWCTVHLSKTRNWFCQDSLQLVGHNNYQSFCEIDAEADLASHWCDFQVNLADQFVTPSTRRSRAASRPPASRPWCSCFRTTPTRRSCSWQCRWPPRRWRCCARTGPRPTSFKVSLPKLWLIL